METEQHNLSDGGVIKPVAVTIPTFTKMFGIGRTTAYSLIRDGRLHRVRIGRRTLITVASAEALIAASSASPKGGA
jgi:hypothetical protein